MPNDEANVAEQRHESMSATERVVALVWSEVLQIPEPAVSEDFFALGGNSMTMVMAEFRLMEELVMELPAGALLGAPTIRELAAVIDAQRNAPEPPVGSVTSGHK